MPPPFQASTVTLMAMNEMTPYTTALAAYLSLSLVSDPSIGSPVNASMMCHSVRHSSPATRATSRNLPHGSWARRSNAPVWDTSSADALPIANWIASRPRMK